MNMQIPLKANWSDTMGGLGEIPLEFFCPKTAKLRPFFSLRTPEVLSRIHKNFLFTIGTKYLLLQRPGFHEENFSSIKNLYI